MNGNVSRILEISFVLILVYLVVTNFVGFGAATSAVGGLYTSSVRTLQGR